MLDIEDYKWAKETLKNMEFFEHCSDDEILALTEKLEKSHHKAESQILFMGEISNSLYIIQNGKVGVWKTMEGKKVMVAELGPGRFFGEISLLTPFGATATIKTMTNVDILTLSSDDFESIYKDHPGELDSIRKKIEERRKKLAEPSK